jgi:uncharacterized protein YecE (DUF72 family)
MPDNYGKFRAGTSGLVLREPNKQAFPEAHRQRSRLSYYATLFNSIEINSSFYKVPMPVTFTKWTHQVPACFQFTLKLWRDITHARGFAFKPADIKTFMRAAATVGSRKGCLLVQLPPSITWNKLDQLQRLLDEVRMSDADPAWRLAVEFRHKSWYREETYRLLDTFGATLVLHDMPASAIRVPTEKARFIYVRFHGVKGDYKGSYAYDHLREYAGKIRGWLQEGKDIYAYFNNTIGDAIANLETLNVLVS